MFLPATGSLNMLFPIAYNKAVSKFVFSLFLFLYLCLSIIQRIESAEGTFTNSTTIYVANNGQYFPGISIRRNKVKALKSAKETQPWSLF